MQPVQGLGPSSDKSNPFCIKSLGNASVSLKTNKAKSNVELAAVSKKSETVLSTDRLPWSGLEIPLKNLEIPQALRP